MDRNNSAGFSLIELMIVLAIAAIIGAVATSFFGDNVQKAQCTEGRNALMNAASALEKCKATYGVYNNAGCNIANFLGNTAGGHFNVTLANAANSFTLTATGQGATGPGSNPFCPTITLDNLGIQGGTGTDPW